MKRKAIQINKLLLVFLVFLISCNKETEKEYYVFYDVYRDDMKFSPGSDRFSNKGEVLYYKKDYSTGKRRLTINPRNPLNNTWELKGDTIVYMGTDCYLYGFRKDTIIIRSYLNHSELKFLYSPDQNL